MIIDLNNANIYCRLIGSKCNHKLYVAFGGFIKMCLHWFCYCLRVLNPVFVAVGKELVPVICIIVFVALWKIDNIQNSAFKVQFQFLELYIEFSAYLIFNIVIELVAFNHLFLVFNDNIIENSFDVFLFVLSFTWRLLVICPALHITRFLRFGFDWFICVEKGQYLGHFINIDSPEESAIIIFQLFFTLLDELLARISK